MILIGKGAGSNPWPRLAALGLLGGVMIFCAKAVASGVSVSASRLAIAFGIALAPIACFLAANYPLIFPFTIYVALVPSDSLLSVTKGVTIAHVVAALSAFTVILRILITRAVVPPGRAWYGWFAMTAWMVTTLLWTEAPTFGRTYTSSVVDLFLMMTVLAIYPLRRIEFTVVTWAIIVTGVGIALYALAELHSGTYSDSRLTITTGTGLVVDMNYFGSSFVLPVSLALASAFYARRFRLRLLCVGLIMIMMLALLQSGSRGAFVSVLVPFAYFVWRGRNRLLIGAVTLASLGLSAFVPMVWQRFFNDPSSQGSGSGRTFIWQVGLHSLHDHWLAGAGVGSFPVLYDRSLLTVFQQSFEGWDRPSHSLLVGTLTETGIIGLALVLFAWYLTFRQTRFVPKTSEYYPMRLAIEGAVLGLFVTSLFIDPYYIKYVWLANTLPLMLTNLLRPAPKPLFSDTYRASAQSEFVGSYAGSPRPNEWASSAGETLASARPELAATAARTAADGANK